MGSAAHSPSNQSSESGHDLRLYKMGDGRDAIGCSTSPDGDLCATSIWPRLSFKDCSDEQYACVFDNYNVVAVPRDTLMAGQSYTVFGAALTVERCFGNNESCETAMISSTCFDDAVCSCRRAEVGKTKVTFYYSRDLGVTAFYTAAAGTAHELGKAGANIDELNDAIPLRTFVLVAEKGFLRAPLSVRAAKLVKDCSN